MNNQELKQAANNFFIQFYPLCDEGEIPVVTNLKAKEVRGIAKFYALKSVDELIKEHTFKNPISWNTKRKKYWEQIKKEIESY